MQREQNSPAGFTEAERKQRKGMNDTKVFSLGNRKDGPSMN